MSRRAPPLVSFAVGLLLLAACGDRRSIAERDLLVNVTTDVSTVVTGQGFPVTVTRVWRKDLVPAAWDDGALAPLVVRLEERTRREDARRVEETRRYRGYAFTRSDVVIPPVQLSARSTDGGPRRATRSRPVRVRVRSTLDPRAPGAPELPGMPERASSRWPAWALGAAVALALIALGLRRARGRRAARVAAPPPAAERALALLRGLRTRTPGDAEAIRADVVVLADVVRDVVAARHGVRARERTTPEILAALAVREGLAGTRAALADLLAPCDRTKFAAHAPGAGERAALLDAAEAFVRASADPEEAP